MQIETTLSPVLDMEYRAKHVPDKCSTTELCPVLTDGKESWLCAAMR